MVKLSNSEKLKEETKYRALYIDQTGSTLLHYACDPSVEKTRRQVLSAEAHRFNKFPNPHTARMILSVTNKYHIDTSNNDGIRPIHLAVKGGCRLTVQTLIAHGCHLDYGGDDYFDSLVKLVGYLPLNQSISLKCLSGKGKQKVVHPLKTYRGTTLHQVFRSSITVYIQCGTPFIGSLFD